MPNSWLKASSTKKTPNRQSTTLNAVAGEAETHFTNPHDIPGAAAFGSQEAIPLHEFHYLRNSTLTHT